VITLRLSRGALRPPSQLAKRKESQKKDYLRELFSYSMYVRISLDGIEEKEEEEEAQVRCNLGWKHPLGYRQFVARHVAELNACHDRAEAKQFERLYHRAYSWC
jgi:hypothetical protein